MSLLLIYNCILHIYICKRVEARIQGHLLGLWDTQRDWIELFKYKRQVVKTNRFDRLVEKSTN